MRKILYKILVCLSALTFMFVFIGCGEDSSQPEDKLTLSINKIDNASLNYGDELQLKVTTNGKTVAWEIDGEDLGCTISDTGLFTAGTTAGEVAVKAYLKEDATISDKCNLSIVEPTVNDKSVSINGEKNISVDCGGTKQLSATANGGTLGYKIEGESLNSSVSNSGLFTAGNIAGTVVVKVYLLEDETVFDNYAITITQNIPSYSIAINNEDVTRIDCNNTVQLTATAPNGTVAWTILGSTYGCEVNQTSGLFTAGSIAGSVIVKAYIVEQPTVSDTCTVTVLEESQPLLFVTNSASPLGTAHNNISFATNCTYTFRTYFLVREYGSFAYSFYYDNKLDTSWWNVPEATANRYGARFTIEEAYFGDGGTNPNGSVVSNSSVRITFGGQNSKVVNSGEEFTSDEVTVNVPNGHFLAFTWTITLGSDSPSIPFTECETFSTCYKKQGTYSSQEEATGFSDSAGPFAHQVLIAPNRINYKHQKTADTKNLVFIGDSITQGVSTKNDLYENWVGQIAKGLPTDYSVWNLGSGWATAGNMASTNGVWLNKACIADELFICIGVNDLGGNISINEYKTLINTIVSTVNTKNPNCIITLFTVPPFNYSGTQGDTWYAMNNWIREQNIDGVDRYFDISAVLSQPSPNEKDLQVQYMSSSTDAHPNGLAGADVARSFLAWYNGAADTVSQVYDRYFVLDVNSAYTLPKTVMVKTAGDYYVNKPVSWNIQVNTASVGTTTHVGTIEGTELKVTYTIRIKGVESSSVYSVNCGNELNNNSTSLRNSAYDKAFGVDSVSGKSWGYDNSSNYLTERYWEDNEDKWLAIRCTNNANNAMLYKFELDAGEYVLSLGFKDPWNVYRTISLTVDGVTLDNAIDNGSGTQTTKDYAFTVGEAKVVEILLTGTNNQGSALNWLEINKKSIPALNDLMSVVSGNGFVTLNWTEAMLATSYEVWYGDSSGNYTNHVTVTGLTTRIGGLTNGTKYYFVVRGVNEEGNANYSNEMSCIPQAVADANVIYYVDCGSLGALPLGDKLGLNQSIEDKAYGIDQITGKNWGYTLDGAVWASGDAIPDQSVLCANLGTEKVGLGIHYAFDIDNGDYDVEVTFYDTWKNTNRISCLKIEGETKLEKNIGNGVAETVSYEVSVTDGELNIDIVGGQGNNDNMMVAVIKVIKK